MAELPGIGTEWRIRGELLRIRLLYAGLRVHRLLVRWLHRLLRRRTHLVRMVLEELFDPGRAPLAPGCLEPVASRIDLERAGQRINRRAR